MLLWVVCIAIAPPSPLPFLSISPPFSPPPALSFFYMDTYTARQLPNGPASVPTVPFPGTPNAVPATSNIGGQPRRQTKLAQEPIVYPYPIKTSRDGSHLKIRTHKLLFITRMPNNEPGDMRHTIVTLNHLNGIRRQAWEIFTRTLGASPDEPDGMGGDSLSINTTANALSRIDHIPAAPAGQRYQAPTRDDMTGSDHPATIAMLRKVATGDDYDASTIMLRAGRTAHDGYYAPSTRRLWKMARRANAKQIAIVNPRVSGHTSIAEALREHVNNSRRQDELARDALTMADAMEIREQARFEIDEIYAKHMHKQGRYASKYELRDSWNFLGACRNTSWQRDTVGEQMGDRVPFPTVNVTLHDLCFIENYWGNGLRAGMELYLIDLRHKSSNDRYSYFQYVPWHGPPQTRPSPAEREYVDISGSLQLADLIHVGTVHEDQHNINAVPDYARRAALNLLEQPLSLDAADAESAKLDIIRIRIRGTPILA